MKSSTLFIILTSVMLFLMLICIFIYTFFPLSYSSYYLDYFRVDFNNVQFIKWRAAGGTFDLVYYDYIGDQPVVVAYYDINYYDSNNALAFDMVKPSLAVIYKVEELPIERKEFSSFNTYIRELNTIKLTKDNVYSAFLLPPSVNPSLTTFDDPFYITRFYDNNNTLPRFYRVERIGFDATVGTEGKDYDYMLYVFGEGYIDCGVNSENLLGGALFTFSNSLKTLHYPRFNWDYDNTGDLLQFFPALYRFGEDCIEYIFMLVSSCFYSFSPFYFLR